MNNAQRTSRARQNNPFVQPFVKWAGGKRQLLPFIRPLIPRKMGCYFEPFVGGGAVLFDLSPAKAVINDVNAELVNCYLIIKHYPEQLIEHATTTHENTSEYFYRLREQDRDPKFGLMLPLERASRLLYLNKTCFNGLFRVNSQGQFNVPFGAYKNPNYVEPAVIRAVSKYLNQANVDIQNVDFVQAVSSAKRGDFVYFDPPYDPISDTSSFTGYNLNGFNREEQRRLKSTCDDLTRRGVKILLSNSDTPFIRDLYDGDEYRIQNVEARRNINSDGAARGKVGEVLVTNYEIEEPTT